MIETLVFENEIQVYFDRVKTLAEGERYVLHMNGSELAESTKTHFTCKDLSPETEYALYHARAGLSIA